MSDLPAWAYIEARKTYFESNMHEIDYRIETIARALVAEREKAVSQEAIKLVNDYNHVHLMLDQGKEWPVVRDYLKANGSMLLTESYSYWLSFTQQRMVMVLAEIVAATCKGEA